MPSFSPQRREAIDRIKTILAAHGFHLPPQTLNELANIVLSPPALPPSEERLREENKELEARAILAEGNANTLAVEIEHARAILRAGLDFSEEQSAAFALPGLIAAIENADDVLARSALHPSEQR